MEPRGTKRKAEKTEVAKTWNKLPRSLPSLRTQPSLYSGPFPFYRRPSELGCFSLDSQRQYHGDARALRYYSPPPINGPGPDFDLRDGYPDRYQPRDEEVRERLDHLLRWVLEHRNQLEGGPGWLAGATVTWRGHLTKLLTTPYERQEGWQLAASRFQGTLYLSEVETPAARAQRLARPPLLRELMYMGYKFEQYMCAGESCRCRAARLPFRRGREPLPLLLASLLVQTNLEAPQTLLGKLTPTWPSALCYAAAWGTTLSYSPGR